MWPRLTELKEQRCFSLHQSTVEWIGYLNQLNVHSAIKYYYYCFKLSIGIGPETSLIARKESVAKKGKRSGNRRQEFAMLA